jgi:hypothetical protein
MNLGLTSQNIKLLEENIAENIYDFAFGNVFFYMTPKPLATKEIIDKLCFIHSVF